MRGQVQHLTAENSELQATCVALRQKLISLESIMTHTERMEAKAEQVLPIADGGVPLSATAVTH